MHGHRGCTYISLLASFDTVTHTDRKHVHAARSTKHVASTTDAYMPGWKSFDAYSSFVDSTFTNGKRAPGRNLVTLLARYITSMHALPIFLLSISSK